MQIARKAREALWNKKGEDVLILDVQSISGVTDFYVISTGINTPHLKALAQEVEKRLKQDGISCYRKSGSPESAWMVADFVDAVVHIFTRDTRAYYSLEQLWSDARRVE